MTTADASLRLGLRTVAVAIAIAAAIDPSVTSRRAAKPEVVVLAADSAADAGLADDAARALGAKYTVIRSPIAGASATVVAGRRMPAGAPDGAGATRDAPVFAVRPATDRPSVVIASLDAPAESGVSRVRVAAQVRVTGARGRTVEITLRDGALAVDRVTRQAIGDDDTLDVALAFVPATAAVTTLRVVAHVDGAADASGDLLVDVRDRRWPVLFYDPRPSWMSTFVRRAIERDPRFVATSRVVTSRDVATDAGNPPARLDDLAALSSFDAVVVGAPQALSAGDVAGLDAFMRRRGGTVVLLLDTAAPGSSNRLIGVTSWDSVAGNALLRFPAADGDSLGLQATAAVWPRSLPVGARVLAGTARAVVWREPVGAGTLVVSGALDAWRFRDPAASSFDRFWQTAIGDAANLAPAAIALDARPRIVAPGERIALDATLRDDAIGGARDSGSRPVRATLGALGVHGALDARGARGALGDSGDAVRLWPRGAGRLAGDLRAPTAPGPYRVTLAAGGGRVELPIVVAADPRRVVRGADADLDDLVRATGGATISASRMAELPSLLARAVRAEPRLVTWHPLRSGWWIVPFVLALSGDWWLRRRRGLP